MKCPNCDYKDGWGWYDFCPDEYLEIKGEEGKFWELPLSLERNETGTWEGHRKAEVYGCPKCKFVFHTGS